jgi:inorganic pyrophosphatase
MCYPLLITASGIIVCMLTTLIATDLKPARVVSEIENTLKGQLIISTLAMTPVRVGECLEGRYRVWFGGGVVCGGWCWCWGG